MTTPRPDREPTVVFIAQLGTGGDSWQPVIDHMETGANTFTYDRPGTGSRPPRPAPNPPLPYSAFAAELEQLLEQSGITGPLVVVGHSVGSLIARVFVDRNLDRIAGVVHVDGSIPRLSLWPAVDYPQSPDGDGPDATHFDRLAGEVEVLDAQVPDVSSAVIARTPGHWDDGWPAEKLDPIWLAYQRQLARQHRALLITATDAGHQIPDEAPALVAHVVDQVVRCARTGARLPFAGREELAAAGGAVTPLPGR
jgi:pimeloyl-ACP methyl ester carboxylesterase